MWKVCVCSCSVNREPWRDGSSRHSLRKGRGHQASLHQRLGPLHRIRLRQTLQQGTCQTNQTCSFRNSDADLLQVCGILKLSVYITNVHRTAYLRPTCGYKLFIHVFKPVWCLSRGFKKLPLLMYIYFADFNQHCVSTLSPQTYSNKLGSDWLSSPAVQRWHHVPADHGQAVEEEESSYTSGLGGAREQWYVCFKYLYQGQF